MTDISKEAVARLAKRCLDNGKRWRVGDAVSEQRASDFDIVSVTLTALRAELDRSEARVATLEGTAQAMTPGAVESLSAYQQADMDGIMVLVSRQAIEECLPVLRALADERKDEPL